MSRLQIFALLWLSLWCLQCAHAVDVGEKSSITRIGDQLGMPFGWNSDSDPCNWVGVICIEDHIALIAWSDRDLSGTLDNQFIGLPYLRVFDVSLNSITGSIPDTIGYATVLTDISLAHNQISSTLPASIKNLSNLQTLKLQSNRIEGSIPPTWGTLINLRQITLTENRLSGSIPDIFGSMDHIESVELGNNQLSGSIPPSLYSRTLLSTLSLESNQLSGSLSSSVSQLTSVTFLQLSDNRFTGTIPPQIGSMESLRELDLRINQFSGAVPDVFEAMKQLNYFRLSQNPALGGLFPASLSVEHLTAVEVADTSIDLCNPSLVARDIHFGGLAECDVTGKSSCGCSGVWAGCIGALHCPDSQCYGTRPWPSFYCSEMGWRADSTQEIPSGTNLTLVGQTYIQGSLIMDETSILIFDGLESTLFMTKCAGIVTAEVHISEKDLNHIMAAKQSIFVDTLMIAPCGVGTIQTSSVMAASCKQARPSIVINYDNNSGLWTIAVEYSGYYSACATWTIPTIGAIQALVVAAGIAYLVVSYCRPRS